MKVWGVEVNTRAEPLIFTSLKALCDHFGLKYTTVAKKRQIKMGGVMTKLCLKRHKGEYTFYDIKEYELVKIKGRENNGRKRKNL